MHSLSCWVFPWPPLIIRKIYDFLSGLWQDAHIPQCAQFPPQEEIPFFLSFTSLKITAVTMAMRINDTTIFPIFAVIHVTIRYLLFQAFDVTVIVSLSASLYFLKKSM